MTTIADAPEGTATLQMVRADVNVRDFQRWMGTRRLQDPDHAMHCLLTETFGELAPKPFRLMIPRGCRQGTLYGYGTATTAALREAAGAFADPLQLRAVPPAGVDTKPMPPEWQKGKRLGFEIRVRPVSGRPGVRSGPAPSWMPTRLMQRLIRKEKCPEAAMRSICDGCRTGSNGTAAPRWSWIRPNWCPSSASGPSANTGAGMWKDPTPCFGACFQSPTPGLSRNCWPGVSAVTGPTGTGCCC